MYILYSVLFLLYARISNLNKTIKRIHILWYGVCNSGGSRVAGARGKAENLRPPTPLPYERDILFFK